MNFNNPTKTGNTPFQNLDAISALTEISDEAAATCSGGIEPVTLYDDTFTDRNFDPKATRPIFGDVSNLGNFNDKTSAVIVRQGTWRLYPDQNFKDSVKDGSGIITLGPGTYDVNALQGKGLKNDTLTSIKRIA